MNAMTLDALVERARAGDRDALEGLVRSLQDGIHRLSLRFLGHPEAARDATQEILILVITQLSTFRGESSVTTWAYRVATRHLMRSKKQTRRFTFETLQAELGQPANAIEPGIASNAEERLLEEELFLGCTQAMLLALDAPQRIAFVLGAVMDLDSEECARILEISEVTFRKRLSRARQRLDAFLGKHCGVANSEALCRCRYQVNHATRQGRFDSARLRFARPCEKTSLEALRALGEIRAVRRSLEIYQAQPKQAAPDDFALHVRELLERSTTIQHHVQAG